MSSDEKKLTFVEKDDVETQIFDWGRLSWLSEPRVTEAKNFSAGVVNLEPGKGHDRHNHPGCEEILYVISGKGQQVVELPSGTAESEIGPGVLVHIPADLYHWTINSGSEPLELIAVYSPHGPEALLRAMEGVNIEPAKRS